MTHNTESDSATTANTTPAPRRRSDAIDWGDVAISAALLAIFVAAFVNAQQWQAIAALFPQVATGIGAVLSAGFLGRSLLFPRKPSATPKEPATVDTLAAAQDAE